MVAPIKPVMTLDDFKTFVAQPENAGRLFELINGAIIEKIPGRTSNSGVSHLIAVPVHNFCKSNKFSESRFWRGRQECRPYSAMVTRRDAIFRVRDDRESQIRDSLKLPCYTSGGDGAYNIQGNVVAPDFAFKTTPWSDDYPDPVPPLWAVEIVSPTDKPDEIADKRAIYVSAGILYWEMYPKSKTVQVYAPGKPMVQLGIGDTLDGGDILAGFTLLVKDVFEGS